MTLEQLTEILESQKQSLPQSAENAIPVAYFFIAIWIGCAKAIEKNLDAPDSEETKLIVAGLFHNLLGILNANSNKEGLALLADADQRGVDTLKNMPNATAIQLLEHLARYALNGDFVGCWMTFFVVCQMPGINLSLDEIQTHMATINLQGTLQ